MGPTAIGCYPVTGLINPLWGSVFGFPLNYVARNHAPGHHPWTEPAALLLWPLVVYAVMALAAARLLASSGPLRDTLIGLWVISAFAVVPVEYVGSWFHGWPIWVATY